MFARDGGGGVATGGGASSFLILFAGVGADVALEGALTVVAALDGGAAVSRYGFSIALLGTDLTCASMYESALMAGALLTWPVLRGDARPRWLTGPDARGTDATCASMYESRPIVGLWLTAPGEPCDR